MKKLLLCQIIVTVIAVLFAYGIITDHKSQTVSDYVTGGWFFGIIAFAIFVFCSMAEMGPFLGEAFLPLSLGLFIPALFVAKNVGTIPLGQFWVYFILLCGGVTLLFVAPRTLEGYSRKMTISLLVQFVISGATFWGVGSFF
jgi:hypothetical protein